MQSSKSIFVYGFALFAMFFGSGNLVFPIKIGQITGQDWLFGFLGLFITGIILPFLGLFVIKLHKGNYISFFNEAGSLAKVLLPIFTLSLLGSFGVVPRCITVAYGGMSYIAPQISLELFSLVFCIIAFFFCLKDQRVIDILGKWMSPILLVILSALIITAIIYSGKAPEAKNIESLGAFHYGFITGYQTMDLFAAFFFSSLIFIQIQKALPLGTAHKDIIIFAIKPSIIGAILLSFVYLGFVYLGAYFSDLIVDVQPEFMLATVAYNIMGRTATVCIAIVMLLSCLTTAVALNNIYARYLCSILHLAEDKFPIILMATTLISFVVSLFDFKGIASFLSPMLEITYPSIIILTILSILTNKLRFLKVSIFYMFVLSMIVGKLFY